MKFRTLGTLLTTAIITIGSCNRVPNPKKPEDLLKVGQTETESFYFVETPYNNWDGKEYRLHVKTQEGNNFIFYDSNQNGIVDRFPNSFSEEDAQEFYNRFVPEEYRSAKN